MVQHRPVALLCGLSLLVAPAYGAEMILELPRDESPAAWEPVLQSVGLRAGVIDQAPWAQLVREDQACELRVATAWGATLEEAIDCPDSTAEREEVASLAAVMLAPMVMGAYSLTDLPSAVPEPAAVSVPGGEHKLDSHDSDAVSALEQPRAPPAPPPLVFDLIPGEDRSLEGASADAVLAEQPAGSPSGPAGLQLDDRLTSVRPVTVLPPSDGTKLDSIQCHYSGCAAVVDRSSCGKVDDCSTAEKCPDTYWQDHDHDGFGSSVCVDLNPDGRIGGIPVQNVGDCDDHHATVNPDAIEVIGDGIDNDCDGVTR